MLNVLPTEFIEQVGVIDPQSDAAGADVTGWIKADTHYHYLCQLIVGAMTATGTLDGKIEQANTAGGGGAKDVTGKAFTQIADTGGSKTYAINVKPTDLDIANGFLWFRLSVTPATAASLLTGQVLGVAPKQSPVPQTNWAQVK